jgi:hypothetical protein
MQLGSRLFTVLLLPFSVILMGTAVEAQSPARTHLGHVSSGFNGAPDGRGLAVTTAMEISLTMMHANLAVGDLADLDNMKTHVGHVLHLISPAEGAQGPGLGFGVIPGIEGSIRHIELAMNADGASESLRAHAAHVALAARGEVARAEQAVELAQQILAVSAATEAAPFVEELRALALALDTGSDVNGNGRLDLDGIEGGFGQLENHLYLILEGEMLPRVLQ